MDITFSWAWFFGGLGIIIASVVFLRFHEFVANNFGGGMSDYERYKLYAVIAAGVGFLAMLNLIPIILGLLVGSLFGGGSNPAA
jgi:hypothetical protein